jgi:hypothetical protein
MYNYLSFNKVFYQLKKKKKKMRHNYALDLD